MYDVVIVGAGSAGCVIASRLSENPNLSVALVEAGPDYETLTDTPYDLINSHNNSYKNHDWGFQYEPTQGRLDRFPRGRVTGGSSAVNTTIALRGMPEDYDEWADLGNTGWTWDEVLPAFNRLERDLDFPNETYHGDSGPITIRRYPREELTVPQAGFLDAAERLGYPYCADANEPWGWGAGPHPMNMLGRLRVSAAVGYLAPARIRPNLSILPNRHVRRLVLEGRKCTGLEVINGDEHGDVEVINAKLVVLCAGALMSPGIMMRSGLGPRDEVEGIGVDFVADVAGVGKNLSDHPASAVVCEVRDGAIINHDAPIIQTILRYTSEHSDKRNDLQIEQISFGGRPDGPPQFVIAPVLEYQYGRGTLTTLSADPFAPPKVENRFCEDERDLRPLTDCLQDTLAFLEAEPLRGMIKDLVFPDPARGVGREDLETLVRKFAGSGYHPCGTLKMGPKEDVMAVVDPMGRSHHIDQLVVADASIMPSVPRANTNLTCLMIGEHLGEMMRTQLHDYGL